MGKTYEYFSVISREDYRKEQMKNFVNNYFGSSYKSVVSFFAENQDIGLDELKEIIKMIESGKAHSDD